MRRALAALWLGLGGAVAGACASPSLAAPPKPEDPVTVRRSELEALRATADRVPALEGQIAALERERQALTAAVEVANQRLGLAPFAPAGLERGDFTVKLPDALRVDGRAQKPRKASLARAVGDARRGLVLAYWATWCKPCTSDEELARLAKLRAELATQGAELAFLAIDGIDKVLSDPRADRWLYPLWQRDQGHLEMLPEAFVRRGGLDLPLMLVVGKGGRVSWVRRGALDDDAARDLLTAVIRGGD